MSFPCYTETNVSCWFYGRSFACCADNTQVRLDWAGELMNKGELTMALTFTEEAIALDKYFIHADLLRAKILTKVWREKCAWESCMPATTSN